MLFLRSWLQQYIDLSSYSSNEIADVITRKSSEVEEILTLRDYFGGKVLVGKIENVRPHPNADKLKMFDVSLGNERVQIISGAPNVVENMLVGVALEGAKLPGGTILPRKMRGELSQGMAVGKSELALETGFSSGLWELEEEFLKLGRTSELGQSICLAFPEYFPEETLFDIKVLPDKIGAIGNYLGLSREIAICLEKPELLTKLAQNLLNPEFVYSTLRDTIAKLPASTLQTHTKFTDVTGFSNTFVLLQAKLNSETVFDVPHEWQKRMFLTGKNLIGGIADVSNYFLLDLGQPTHFFDTQKVLDLGQNMLEWKIEKTNQPQSFNGLGQLKSTTIPKDVEVLTDIVGNTLSIPGISGGDSTKIDNQSADILIEVANFSGQKIARNSFALNYRSDGGKIWAGGVQPQLSLVCLLQIITLLSDKIELSFVFVNFFDNDSSLNHFTLNSADIFNHITQKSSNTVVFHMSYLAQRLDGCSQDYWQPIILSKLTAIGDIRHIESDVFELTPNLFYNYIHIQEDVLAEVVRLVGFDALQTQSLQFTTDALPKPQIFADYNLKQLVSEFGFTEIITRPFVSSQHLSSVQKSIKEVQPLELINPYSSKEPFLRNSLWPSLLQALSENMLRGEKKNQIFELNTVYSHLSESKQIQQTKVLGLVYTEPQPYIATSLIHALAEATGLNQIEVADQEISELGQKTLFSLTNSNIENQKIIAELTEVKNNRKREYNIPTTKPVWILEIFLSDWSTQVSLARSYKDESDFPKIRRTYSISLPQTLTWQTIQNVLESEQVVDTTLLIEPRERFTENKESLQIFDVLNFNVEFTSQNRTLQNSEIQEWETGVLNQLQKLGSVAWR